VKEDQKNFILFAVIAAALLIAWPMATSWLFPEQQPVPVKVEAGQTKVAANPGADPAADTPRANRDRAVVLRETPRVTIDTPSLKGSINLKGARIDDLELKRHKETVAKDSAPIRLLSPGGTTDAYFAQFGWLGTGVEVPGPDTIWQTSGPRLAPNSPVVLTAANTRGQRFSIELSIDDNYMFSIRQRVENRGAAAVALTPYALVTRANKSVDIDQWAAHVGPIAVYNGTADYIDYGSVEGGDKQFATTGGWVGFTDHYWLTALVPAQNLGVVVKQRQTKTKGFQADYELSAPLTVEPGKAVSYASNFFAGAKEVALLDNYERDLGIVQFAKAIDWGWFGVIEQPIFYYLHWLFRLVGNFGVAIILLTITIRGLLFPIAQKQFASMAQMRAIQPKMKELQERYKEDKQKQQQEIMKLYKQEKVNPLAGCVPILLQIPIMFALYKVLLLTIEMRHQPFVWWIKDLSAPDPALLLNLFGLLNFQPWTFLAIGVFPLLLGISMYYQIKLNPAPMDEMQKQIFAIMPWMLMFVMAPFAVGLQLYWITSNVITIMQQRWLYSKHPALKEPIKKDPPPQPDPAPATAASNAPARKRPATKRAPARK
jgi:YidC/Oxa1 family membrane protein insertase